MNSLWIEDVSVYLFTYLRKAKSGSGSKLYTMQWKAKVHRHKASHVYVRMYQIPDLSGCWRLSGWQVLALLKVG